MAILRIFGYLLITLGIVLTVTIFLAWIGIPMLLLGLLFVFVGKKRNPIVIQVQQQTPPSDNR